MNEGKMFTFGACGLGTRSRFGRVACVVEKWKRKRGNICPVKQFWQLKTSEIKFGKDIFSNPVDLMHKKLEMTPISVL